MADKASLITLIKPAGPAAEAYRTLRTNLDYVALDRPLTTLVVTSPAAGEGKSIVLANLAVNLAQSGKKTILVDADLRRPSLAGLFGVVDERGLSAAITAKGTFDSSLLADVGVDRLKLLPSGELPANPADLLASQRMEQLIAAFRQQAEIVLFDAPPVVPVTDAAVLGSKVDGLLLVIEARRTRRDQAEKAMEILDRVNVRILGSVLHNARRSATLGGY